MMIHLVVLELFLAASPLVKVPTCPAGTKPASILLRKYWNAPADKLAPGPRSSILWEMTSIGPEATEPASYEVRVESVMDMNADGIQDVVLYTGMCGSRGDCTYGVLVGCGQGYFTSVWGDYAETVGLASPPSPGSWPKLRVTERISNMELSDTCFAFQEGSYEQEAPCGDEGEPAPPVAVPVPAPRPPTWKVLRAGKARAPTGAAIVSLDVSGDGRFALSASDSLRLWDISSGKVLRRFGGAAQLVRFAPKGTLAASSQLDGTVILWNTTTGKAVRTLRGEVDPNGLAAPGMAWSADGRFLATAAGTLAVWDVKTGAKLWSREGFGWSWALALSPDGKRVLTGDTEGNVTVVDGAQPDDDRVLRSSWVSYSNNEISMPIQQVAISPDGQRALAVHARGRVTLWHLPTGKELAYLGDTLDFSRVAVSRDWRHYAVTSSEQPKDSVLVYGLHWPSPALDRRLSQEDSLIETPEDARESFPQVWQGTVTFAGTGETVITADGRYVLKGDAQGNLHRLSLSGANQG